MMVEPLAQKQTKLAQKQNLRHGRQALEKRAVDQGRENKHHHQRQFSRNLRQATIDTLCSGMNCDRVEHFNITWL